MVNVVYEGGAFTMSLTLAVTESETLVGKTLSNTLPCFTCVLGPHAQDPAYKT